MAHAYTDYTYTVTYFGSLILADGQKAVMVSHRVGNTDADRRRRKEDRAGTNEATPRQPSVYLARTHCT